MELLLYLAIFIGIIIIFYMLKDKNTIITILCSMLIIDILISPKTCIEGAIYGASLFFYKVFPSLFLFLIVSNIIIECNGIYIYSKLFGKILCRPLRLPKNCSFTLIISMLCGYPLGAKYASDLYREGEINKNTFERLLNIASNSSPLFILGSVGISMFKSESIGYMLLLSNLLSCMVMGIILPSKKNYVNNSTVEANYNMDYNIGNIFKKSIENTIKTCLSIGGFVTVFSVINTILIKSYVFNLFVNNISHVLNIPNNTVSGTLLGLIEMTNGCNLISISDSSLYVKIFIVSFLFTFSGFSIICQVYSFTYKFHIPFKKYIFKKIIHGLICSGLSILALKVYNMQIISKQVFLYYYQITGNTSSIGFITIIILMFLPIILFKIKQLLHII